MWEGQNLLSFWFISLSVFNFLLISVYIKQDNLSRTLKTLN